MKMVTLLVATLILSTSAFSAEIVGWVQCSDGTVVKENTGCGDFQGGFRPR